MLLLRLLLVFLCALPAFADNGASADTAYLWRQAVGGEVIGQPTVQAQSVVVALDGGTIKAYSASGRPLWSYSARGRLSPYITRSREGTSYICRTNGILIAVNRVGRELWRANTGGALSGYVVPGWDGRLFVPAMQKILCYTASGNLLWTRELDDAISSGPWLDKDGGILLALKNAEMLQIDPYGAATVRKLSSVPRILLTGSPILALFDNGDMQFVDPKRQDAAALPRLPSPPVAAACSGGNAAVALANGQAILLSCADGSVLWTSDTHDRIRQGAGRDAVTDAAVVYDERGVYVLSKNGATAFTGDGRRVWYTILDSASGVPAFDDSGVLYSGGTDWILYAWKVEDRPDGPKTLFGPAPEGVYGKGVYPPAAFSGYIEDSQVQRELDTIRREILAGRVGENERRWLVYLMNIAESGLRQGIFSVNRPGAQITHRILALQLLSRIGSNETIPWLVRFFRLETEPYVKAAAARAIGGIGVDHNGAAMQEFLAVANARAIFDERVLVSVASATGDLCRFSGPPLFAAGARILVLLGNPELPLSVQEQARYMLHSLSE